MGSVNFVYCTKEKYDTFKTKNENTLYFVVGSNTTTPGETLGEVSFIAKGSEVIATKPVLNLVTEIPSSESGSQVPTSGAVRKSLNSLAPIKVVNVTIGSGETPILNESGLYYIHVINNGTSNDSVVQLLTGTYKTEASGTASAITVDVVEGTLISINNFEPNTNAQIYVLQSAYNNVLDYYNINKTTTIIENHYALNTNTLKALNELSSLQLGENQLISSSGVDSSGVPIFKVITLGTGLKIENNILSLDIANGDTLKYGTSTQSVETNGNEVTASE